MHITPPTHRLLSLLLVLGLLPGLAWTAHAAADDALWLRGRPVSGSGVAASADGAYRLVGAAGQPDAGMPLSGGEYALRGGLIVGTRQAGPDLVFLPLVLRGQ